MSSKAPPPPAIGTVYEGPIIGHGKPKVRLRPGRYYVRAIVDPEEEEHPDYGWLYWIVFRFYTRHKGWRYEITHSSAIAVGLYKKAKRQPKARP